MRRIEDWDIALTPAGRVVAVRCRTTPLVELRLRWDHPVRLHHTAHEDRLLAADLMSHAASSSAEIPTCQLTAHANDYRFGVAITCWRDSWPSVLRAVLVWLVSDHADDLHAETVEPRSTNDLFHRRDSLDRLADAACLRQVLGLDEQEFTPMTDVSRAARKPADAIADAQQRLSTAAPLIVLVGDLDSTGASRRAADLLGCLWPLTSQGPSTLRTAVDSRPPLSHIHAEDGRTACRTAMVVPPSPWGPRTAGDVIAQLVGNPDSGLLVTRLRHQLGYAYDARCTLEDHGHQRILTYKATVADRHAEQTVREMQQLAGANLAVHRQFEKALARARSAVIAARSLIEADPASRATDLVKAIAAGIDPADALDASDHVAALASSEVRRLLAAQREDSPR